MPSPPSPDQDSYPVPDKLPSPAPSDEPTNTDSNTNAASTFELSCETKKLSSYLKSGSSELNPLPAKQTWQLRQLYGHLCEFTDPVSDWGCLRRYGIPNQKALAANNSLCCGCIFVDPLFSYVRVEFQRHLNDKDTLNAATAFEQEVADSGVTIAE